MTVLEELKYHRNAALIVVCTFGFAALPKGSFSLSEENNIFRGTGLDKGGFGFVLKIVSVLLLAIPFAIVMFAIFLFKLIYYQIEIFKLTW